MHMIDERGTITGVGHRHVFDSCREWLQKPEVDGRVLKLNEGRWFSAKKGPDAP